MSTSRSTSRTGAQLRLCIISDATTVKQEVEEACCPPYASIHFPLSAVLTGADGTGDATVFEQLLTEAEASDAILIAWDLLQAPRIGTLCYRLRNAQAPIIALCEDREEEQIAALVVGTDDYLVMPPSVPLLKAQIVAHRRLGQGVVAKTQGDGVHPEAELVLTPPAALASEASRNDELLRAGPIEIDRKAFTLKIHNTTVELTPRQLAVLIYLVKRPNTLLSRDLILEEVWGIDFETGTNMVDVYIHFIRRVLKEHGLPDLIHTVRGRGYRFTLPPAPPTRA